MNTPKPAEQGRNGESIAMHEVADAAVATIEPLTDLDQGGTEVLSLGGNTLHVRMATIDDTPVTLGRVVATVELTEAIKTARATLGPETEVGGYFGLAARLRNDEQTAVFIDFGEERHPDFKDTSRIEVKDDGHQIIDQNGQLLPPEILQALSDALLRIEVGAAE